MTRNFQKSIKQLSKPKKSLFYAAFFSDWLGIFLSCFLSYYSPIIFAPFYVISLGIFQHRLALLGHDVCHINFGSSQAMRRITAELIGFPMFMTYLGYRKSHFAHHQYLGTPNDPENGYRYSWGFSLSSSKIIRFFFLDLFGYGIGSQIRFIRDTSTASFISNASLLAFWILIVCLAWALKLEYILLMWFAALFTSFWAIFRVRAFLEHVDVPANQKHSTHRFYTSKFLAFIFFPHNTCYHYEHHLFPIIPFHNLPALRKLLVGSSYKETLSIREIMDSRKESRV